MSWKERYSVSNRADYHNVTLEDTVPRHSAGNTSNGDKVEEQLRSPDLNTTYASGCAAIS